MLNTTSSPTSLADAVESVLRYGGPELLRNPQRFWGTLTDCYDAELHTTEMEILSHYYSEELLRPFADACAPGVTGVENRLKQAQHRTEVILRDHYHIDGTAAASLSYQLAQGVAQHLGVSVTTSAQRRAAVCSVCGAELPEGAERCPRCGSGATVEVRGQDAHSEQGFVGRVPEPVYAKRCARCGQIFDMGLYACPRCGLGTTVEVVNQYGYVRERYDTTQVSQDRIKKRLYIAIIAGSAIVLVLIAILLAQELGRRSKFAPDPESPPVSEPVSASEAGPSDPVNKVTVDHVGTISGSIDGWGPENTAAGLIVTNQSDIALHLETTFVYSTSSTSAQSIDYVQALGPGESALMIARYTGSANFVSYSIVCEPSTTSHPGRESMAGIYRAEKESQDKYGATVSVTNTDAAGRTIYVRTVSVVATDSNSGRTYVATHWLDSSHNEMALAPGERGLADFTNADVYQVGAHPDWSTLNLGEYYVEGYIE